MEYAENRELSTDMATTFSLLALFEEKAFIAWCGDSRVYHIRDGEILYKTADHSLVGTLVKSGEITEEEALAHPQKNIILRAVKLEDEPVEAESHVIEDLQEGDYFMLCTDGLLENVTDKDLKFLLTQNDKGDIDLIKSFQQFCYNKTKDNYSMYLVKIDPDKKKQKSATHKKYGILMTSLIIISLLSVGAFYFKDALIKPTALPQNSATDSLGMPAQQNVVETESPTGSSDSLSAIKDTLPYVEIIKAGNDDKRDRKFTPPAIKEIRDSTKPIKKVLKKKDSVETAPVPVVIKVKTDTGKADTSNNN
jgi:protein phosphatase